MKPNQFTMPPPAILLTDLPDCVLFNDRFEYRLAQAAAIEIFTEQGAVMHKNNSCNRVVALCLGIVAFVWATTACADPSARVARLGYTSLRLENTPVA